MSLTLFHQLPEWLRFASAVLAIALLKLSGHNAHIDVRLVHILLQILCAFVDD